MKRYALLAVIVIVAGAAAYLLLRPPPLDEAEVRGYADPISENILQAFNSHDYASFISDMDQTMRAAFTMHVFNETVTVTNSKIGDYVSKEYWKAERSGGYISVYYRARFTDETSDVTVRVVFSEDSGGHYVSGLWFDSPNLRS